MFDDILNVVKEQIRTEATKAEMDILHIKSLVDIAQYIQSVGVDSFDSMNVARPMGVGIAPTVARAYGPPPLERMLDEALPVLREQILAAKQPSLTALVEALVALKEREPQIAAQLKAIIERRIKLEEERDESVRSELLGGREPGEEG